MRLLSEALNEPVIVAENGGRRTISKRQAIIKQLVNQSAKGDWRATKLLLDIQLDIQNRLAERWHKLLLETLTPAEYERRRAAYIRAGKGTPPPGATPLPPEEA